MISAEQFESEQVNQSILATPGEVSIAAAEALDTFLPYSKSTPAKYKRRDRLPDDSLHMIQSGCVRVFRQLPGGERVGLGVYGPQHFLGEGCMWGAGTDVIEVLSVEAWVLSWPAASLQSVLEKDGGRISFMALMSERSKELHERMDAERSPVQMRLALALMRICRTVGTLTNGIYILPAISHELIGDEVGTSREIVTTFMNVFRRSGAVSYNRQRIEVVPDLLVAYIAGVSK